MICSGLAQIIQARIKHRSNTALFATAPCAMEPFYAKVAAKSYSQSHEAMTSKPAMLMSSPSRVLKEQALFFIQAISVRLTFLPCAFKAGLRGHHFSIF